MSEQSVIHSAVYQSVVHNTFVIERNYSKPPERVFAAFSDPERKSRWFLEGKGSAGIVEMDFRVGGFERSRFRIQADNPYNGMEIANDTVYQDIVPDSRIVFAYTMTLSGRRFSASLATVEFLHSDGGTHLTFTEQAAFFAGADGAEMRQAGWNQLFNQLAEELAG